MSNLIIDRLSCRKPDADLSDAELVRALENPGIVIGKYAYRHRVIGVGTGYPFHLDCRPADDPEAAWEEVGIYEVC